MKVLVGCERSGVVRDAFRKSGHDVYSIDVMPSVTPSDYHIQDDVRKHLHEGWDLGIFFPECTHICVSGARYFTQKTESQQTALDFVSRLMVAPIDKIAIENPVGVISTRIRKPDQIVNPYEFGHPETKKTCLWLKNLPKLIPTNIVTPVRSGVHKYAGNKNKFAFERAITYQGIANAMANQWG